MAIRIYLTSAEGQTGKSTIAAGLIEQLVRTGKRVGVFRPLVRSNDEQDVILVALLDHANAGFSYGDCVATDYEHLHGEPDEALRLVVDRVAKVEARCDVLVILGSDYTDVGSPTELATNGRIAANLAATVVLVIGGRQPDGGRARTEADIAEITRVALDELREEHAVVSAVIVNRADPERLESILTATTRLAHGLPTWIIAEDLELTSPLLGRVIESVEGRLIKGDAALLELSVRGTVIAAMALENILPQLVEGGLVVVPSDRPEMLIGTIVAHMSQTFPSLSGILVNGGFPIAPQIERVIDGLGTSLPIAVCDLGTYETATLVMASRSRLAADSPRKYALALSLFAKHVDAKTLVAALTAEVPLVLTPIRFERSLGERARARQMHIVLPEGDDDRVLTAAAIVAKQGLARLTILGEDAVVRGRAAEIGVDLGPVRIVSTSDPKLHSRFVEEYARVRAHKGVTREIAETKVSDVSYFGTMMVHLGLVDGMVSGARHTTAHTIRPAFEIIKTTPGISVASSVFLMALADRVLVYGDCAIIPEPTAEQLADIAISSAATAREFGIEPRVAMLSYSTGDSGTGGDVDDVRAATALVRVRAPELPVIGPVQYDAAADPVVAAVKLPGSAVAGHATVFVFPDLNTGNNTYKAVQRTAGAVAIGPILQGLAKPVNDLSRGALVRDIVNTIAITAIQAQETSKARSDSSSPSTSGRRI
ncbi:phosphate acetyltransferase [Glaciibacter superstes]|uniref:phosphate acetyltransferase n=1 Tax=Glaciibacter superstes TaxID=501023 RepID=UPI0003B7AC86|nr:phosphate acetyltransferase [Glaciibacter superstes]